MEFSLHVAMPLWVYNKYRRELGTQPCVAPVLSTMEFEVHSPTLTTWGLADIEEAQYSPTEAGVQSDGQVAELGDVSQRYLLSKQS